MSLGFVFVEYASHLIAEVFVHAAETPCYICVDCGLAYAESVGTLPDGGTCLSYVCAFGEGAFIGVGFHIFSPSPKMYAVVGESRTENAVQGCFVNLHKFLVIFFTFRINSFLIFSIDLLQTIIYNEYV